MYRYHDPERETGDTAIGYGLRCLRQVLVTGCPSELSTEALEAADHAYPQAVSMAASTVVYERLSNARHGILATLRVRQAVGELDWQPAIARLQGPVQGAEGKGKDDGRDGGARVPVRPYSPVLPSGGAKAEVMF